MQREHFALPWSSFYVMCQLDDIKGRLNNSKKATSITLKKDQVVSVSLVNRESAAPYATPKVLPKPCLKINKFPEAGKNQLKSADDDSFSMAVCVKPFHYNFNRVLWLIEFIEMYRLQGFTHFFFYNHTIGPDVTSAILYYKRRGLVSLLNWNLPLISQKEIRTEAMFTAMTDCTLRSVLYRIRRKINNFFKCTFSNVFLHLC